MQKWSSQDINHREWQNVLLFVFVVNHHSRWLYSSSVTSISDNSISDVAS